MAGGLLFSQLLTLYITPVIYTYLDNLQKRFGSFREIADEDAAPQARPSRDPHREIKGLSVQFNPCSRPVIAIFRRRVPPRAEGEVMTILKQIPKLVAALAIAVGLAGCGVNNIPTKDQAVKARWADVQAAYQRRSDLIPNLANTVAGYAAQEKSVLTAVTQARASATQVKVDASTITDPAKFAQFQAAQDNCPACLGRLMAISENYPDL